MAFGSQQQTKLLVKLVIKMLLTVVSGLCCIKSNQKTLVPVMLLPSSSSCERSVFDDMVSYIIHGDDAELAEIGD